MKRKITVLSAVTAAALTMGISPGGISPARADDDTLVVKNKVDEEVRFREDVGLSKARTLGQSDIDKKIVGGVGPFTAVKLHTTLRASYDAVYDINSGKFGDDAGGAVSFQNNDGHTVAWGQGLGSASNPVPPSRLGFNVANNPNQGLALVDGWRSQDNGVAFATPVRPCDVDSRGCIKGYMDDTKFNMAAPELNRRVDILREAYVDAEMPVGDNTLALRVGRQQLVWGRTDLFRVLDVVNPVDYSRNNIYDELQDIRIPMGMIRADYRMGARGPFDDINAQAIWVLEPWRPNNLGTAGSTNTPLGAAQLFRAMKNCWDNGCTVANFAGGATATDFGPHQIGIRNVYLPDDGSPENSTFGGKVEGELKGVGFSVNALSYRSQMPSLHGAVPSDNSFGAIAGPLNKTNTSFPYMIAFDMHFPRVNLFGGSLDFNIEPIDTAIRMEGTFTSGEEFADTAQPELYKKSTVERYVIGADKSVFIPFLNAKKAFLFSGQVFGQHINGYELVDTGRGVAGMPDFQDNWIGTLLIKGWYLGDTLSPQMVMARDMKARANVIEPSVEWTPSSMWRFRLGANIKFGDFRQSFDDVHSNNPYLNAGNGAGYSGGANQGGYWGMEPLGRFQSGILGMAHEESEIFANATFRF